jgi:hypothetical protein
MFGIIDDLVLSDKTYYSVGEGYTGVVFMRVSYYGEYFGVTPSVLSELLIDGSGG